MKGERRLPLGNGWVPGVRLLKLSASGLEPEHYPDLSLIVSGYIIVWKRKDEKRLASHLSNKYSLEFFLERF